MAQRRPIEKIYAAAWYFANISRDLGDIADAFKVSPDAVRKWAKTPEWERALDVFKYEGDRTFAKQKTRDTEREQGEIFEKAKRVYQNAMRDGEPTHKWATIAGDAVGLSRRRVHEWAMKYNWRDEIQKP